MQAIVNIIVHLILLFLVRWLSIAVIVLNTLALNSAKDSDHGLIMAAETGVQDFVLLIMAAASLFAVSLSICLYFQLFYHSSMDPTIKISKKLIITEIVFSIFTIALWTFATAIIMSMFNELSACQNNTDLFTESSVTGSRRLSPHACYLVDTVIIIAFITISLWTLKFLTSLYELAELIGFRWFKRSESQTIHPIRGVWLKVEPNNINANDLTMYNQNIQDNNVSLNNRHVRDDKTTSASKYEVLIQSSSNNLTAYPIPSAVALNTRLKDFNSNFTSLDFGAPIQAAGSLTTGKQNH